MNKKTNKIKIAIDAADLCYKRVDGTRIYIKNILNHLGKFSPKSRFYIYTKGNINSQLKFKIFDNYQIIRSHFPFFWTQLKFPFELKRDKPGLLWMPLQTVPFLMPKNIKTIVTVHDLAFKIFKKHFPLKDRLLLNIFTYFALKRADKIIAVSQNTKKDIIKYYKTSPNDIEVIYHGYDKKIFNQKNAKNKKEIERVKKKYKIFGNYLLYAGALQPRKNLITLLKAFDKLKDYYIYHSEFKDIKLVIAGPKAWLYQTIFDQAKKSRYLRDIVFTGQYETRDLPHLMGGSEMFVFPSLYEGFGIPVLEAMACATPVICAKNSSLTEVGGKAALYFNEKNSTGLFNTMVEVLKDQKFKRKMINKGLSQVKNFSWEKSAKQTYKTMKKVILNS